MSQDNGPLRDEGGTACCTRGSKSQVLLLTYVYATQFFVILHC
jgi:hypothetical protein